MEIELDLTGKKQTTWYTIGIGVFLLLLVGLAFLGRAFTPDSDASASHLLTWQDWRLLKAERAYQHELETLRADADQLSQALNGQPNPVTVQLLAESILHHTGTMDGDPALEAARAALGQAAQDVRDWASGILDRDTALASLQKAIELLK